MTSLRFRLALVVSFAGWLPLLATDDSVRRIDNVTYVKRDNEPLTADIYLPAGGGPFPAVLMVHGGAWRMGDKRNMAMASRKLAARGYVVASINYRLAPRHKYPAQIDDCREAIRWLRRNAKSYQIDPARVGALGYSAGAHLVLLAALTGEAPDPASAEDSPDAVDSRLSAVVGGGTPCDFRLMPKNAEGLSYWLGGTRAELPKVYEEASPAAHVSSAAPPVFLFHGQKDALVPIRRAQKMVESLQQANVTAEFYVVPDKGHIAAFFDETAYEKAFDFLDRYLRKQDP